jgi:hypothetical protein
MLTHFKETAFYSEMVVIQVNEFRYVVGVDQAYSLTFQIIEEHSELMYQF